MNHSTQSGDSSYVKIDRIDFTNDEKCRKCRRELSLGVAHIVIDAVGQEHSMGAHCARAVAPSAETIPDFTKGAFYSEDEVESGEPAAAGQTDSQSKGVKANLGRDAAEYSRALIYLRLRQERMTDFCGVHYERLAQLYIKYKSGVIETEDIGYIKNLMRSQEQKRPLLSLDSLQTAYAYHQLLKRAAKRVPEDKREFLAGIDSHLLKNLYLTRKQIEGANRWLSNLGRIRLGHCKAWP